MQIKEYYNASNNKKAWKISIGIHVSVVLCMFAWMVADWIIDRFTEPPLVFDLVNLPSGNISAEPTTQEPEQLPQEEPSKPLLKQDLPDFKEVEPLKLPEPQEKPKEQPKIEKPKPKVVSYEDFTKKNPIKEPKTTVTQRKPKTVNIPDLNPDDIVKSLKNSLADSASIQRMNAMSQAEQAALLRYHNLIKQAINAQFKAPPGVSIHISTTVWFMVDGQGNIKDAHIVKSSGNSALDSAAMETFKRIHRVTSPPGGKSFSFTLNFKMN
jgi:protein TonB